jgi:cellulose biosynthesis protein BcsQ
VQVVSISSLKGGVGKTSVTLGLASAAMSQGVSTLVVDLDPHADASTGLGADPVGATPIGDLLRHPRRAAIDEVAKPSSWSARQRRRHPDKIARLDVAQGSALTGYYDRPDLRSRDLKRLAAVLSQSRNYELVLVDCPPSLSGLTRMAWFASHGVVLVAEPSLFSVAGTERSMRALELFRSEFSVPLDTVGVVANRYRENSSEHAFRLSELRTMFGEKLLSPVIAELPTWQQIQGAAHAVHHWPGKDAAATAKTYEQLLASVRKGLPTV